MKQRFSKRTRLVSALLTLAMVFTFLPFSALAATTGDVAINSTNFPDPVFQEYLKQEVANGGGSLSQTKREAVTEINVKGGYKGKKITNLKGIEFFSELTCLDCSENNLSSLDVSDNTKLVMLRCYQNELNSLDVTNLALITLNCSKNNLTSLVVSKNENLETLYCYNNQLTNLDVTQFIALEELKCYNNQLTELYVRENPKLNTLFCYNNQLTELDVSQNLALEWLSCHSNNLTSLDVSQTAVTELFASGNQIDINVEETPRTFDLSKLPGAFDVTKASNWVGGGVKGNILTVDEGVNQVTYTYDCGNGLSRDFALNVNVVPDGTVTPPSGGGSTPGGSTGGGSTGGTTPGGPTGGETGGSSGGDGGGGGAIIAVAGAAAVGLVGYGIYNYVAERQLQALLPEGAASPENRAQTALLLWNTAGRPEPAAQPAFPDVADPETAKAAQWCVEHGLMNAKLRGRFAPDGSSPAYKTLNAYRQLVG